MPNRVILSLFPRGFLLNDDDSYELSLCVAGADDTGAIQLRGEFKRENDEEAVEVAKKVAKRIGCTLDLDLVTGEWIEFGKDLE